MTISKLLIGTYDRFTPRMWVYSLRFLAFQIAINVGVLAFIVIKCDAWYLLPNPLIWLSLFISAPSLLLSILAGGVSALTHQTRVWLLIVVLQVSFNVALVYSHFNQ